MSDFELAYLMNEILNAGANRMIEFMTGLFAMLIASYVVGPKLSKGVTWLMIALFTMFAMATIVPAVGTASRLASVFSEVDRAKSVPGSTLAWLTTPPVDVSFTPWFVGALLIGAYVGAIVFLLQVRKAQEREGRKDGVLPAEGGADGKT